MKAESKEILKKVRELISTKEKWTKNACARDREGYPVGPKHVNAVCWCLLGALRKIDPSDTVYHEFRSYLPAYFHVTDFNDNRNTTHEDVLKLLDGVIES